MARQRRPFGALRQLPSGRYQARYIGPDGLHYLGPSTYLLRSDAEAWLRDEEILIDRQQWTPPTNRAVEHRPATVAQWCEHIITRRQQRSRKPLRDSTAATYRNLVKLVIAPELGHITVTALTRDMVRRWYDALPATATQNGNAYQLLRSVMGDAVDDGLIPTNPVAVKGAGKPAPAHVSVALTPTELRTYLAAVADEWRVPLALAGVGALRSGEVRALRRRDITDDGTTVRVARTVSRLPGPDDTRIWVFGDPKTAAGVRTVHLPPWLATGIAQWLQTWDADHPGDRDRLLFATAAGDPLTDGAMWRAHHKGAVACGHPDMSVHDLRKTGATLAAQSGATVRELMARLGHTTPRMAMLYQVASDDRDRAVAERMGELEG